MVKRTFILCMMACSVTCSFAQKDSSLRPLRSQRLCITASANAAFWTGSYIALNKAWYTGYPRSAFHFFNDSEEWNQMDKAGHAWTGYTLSRASSKMWKWAGLNENTSAVLGGGTGMIYQGMIELQDAYSSQWGFSWSDIAANAFGAGLFVAQQLAWKDQRVQLKLGYWPHHYAHDLAERRDDLFGNTAAGRILKDYNAQTYWISTNLASFFPGSNMPRWLNLSLGYGAGGLLGARSNSWEDKQGNSFDFSSTARTRRFFLSPDIDLTRIPVKSRFLRSAFFILNSLKIPAPALELNSRRQLRGHLLKF